MRRPGGFAALNPRLLSVIAAGWGCATPPGSAGSCVRRPGGFATLNPRLLSVIPAGMGAANPEGCQTVAGGRSNAETSG